MMAAGVLAAFCFAAAGLAGQAPPAIVVSGQVVEVVTGQPLPDLLVELTAPNAIVHTARTAHDGRFVLNVPSGVYTLEVRTGIAALIHRRIEVAGPIVLRLEVRTGVHQERVEVAAATTRAPDPATRPRSILEPSMLRELRSIATDDPMRVMQTLPGAATGDDFQAEFSVRGSAFRHVGLVIDGTAAQPLLHSVQAVDNPGSIAMVNTDTLARGALLIGPRAARHGHWLGATLEFDVREGARDRTRTGGLVSGTAASMTAEGPLAGGRGSWLVSFRRSYLDWLIQKLEPGFDSTVGFFDGTAKGTFDLSATQRVEVLVIGGDALYRERDVGAANGLERAASGSTLASVAWRRSSAGWITSTRVSFVGSEFQNLGVSQQQLARGYTQAVTVRADVARAIGADWLLEGGVLRTREEGNETLREFTTSAGRLRVRASRDFSPRTTLTSGWVQTTRRTGASALSAGLRLSDRTLSTGGIAAPWLLAERSAGRLTLLAAASAGGQFPGALLAHAEGAVIAPERGQSLDLGVRGDLHGIEWSMTAFGRRESNGLRVVNEAQVDGVSGRAVSGVFPEVEGRLTGRTRGVDLILARRSATGLSGWIAYTWAHTRMRDRVTGERFDGDFDQRHTLNAVGQYRWSPRTSLGATIRIGSNMPFVGYFARAADGRMWLSTQRNAERLPTYARLDVRASRSFTAGRSQMTLFVEVINLPGRTNFGQSAPVVRPSLEVTRFAERLIPRVPSAGLLIAF
jgi:hypothetical protein